MNINKNQFSIGLDGNCTISQVPSVMQSVASRRGAAAGFIRGR